MIIELNELNKTEMTDDDRMYKYIITAYEDMTRIEYYENNNEVWSKIHQYELPSCHDLQICKKIIELRNIFKE